MALKGTASAASAPTFLALATRSPSRERGSCVAVMVSLGKRWGGLAVQEYRDPGNKGPRGTACIRRRRIHSSSCSTVSQRSLTSAPRTGHGILSESDAPGTRAAAGTWGGEEMDR